MIFSPPQAKDELPSSSVIAGSAEATRQPSARPVVGTALQAHIAAAELERHIADLGWLVESTMARYEASSDLADLGSAHRWRILMEQAIKSRSAETVACLERERGLA